MRKTIMDKRRIRRVVSLVVAMTMTLSVVASAVEAAVATWLAPQPGQKLSTREVEVAVGYNTHCDVRVTKLELWVDGKLHVKKVLVHPQSRGVCSFWWDTARYADGTHDLIVKVYSGDDLLSTVSSTGTVGDYRYDMRPPVVSFANVKNGDVLKGISTLKLDAKDDSGDPPLVSLLVDKSLKLIKNRPPYTYDLDTTSYSDGSHELQTFAYDGSGNKSDPSVVQVAFKNGVEKPVVTAVSVTSHPNPEAFDESPAEAVPAMSDSTASPMVRNSAARSGSAVIGKSSVSAPVAASIALPKASTGQPAVPSIKSTSSESIASLRTNAAARPVITTSNAPVAKIAPALEPEKFSIPPVVASPGQVTSSPDMALRSESAKPSDLVFTEAVEPDQITEAAAAQPIQMAMASTASLRSNSFSGLVSSTVPSAKEMLSAPVSSDTGQVTASVGANTRDGNIEQTAAKGVSEAPPASPTVASPKPVHMACAPFVNDANAQAASNHAIGCPPSIKKDSYAKLEKKTAPVSGKIKLRDLYNDLNGLLFWDAQTHTVTALTGNMKMELTIGSNVALVNGHKMILSQVPSLVNGRTVIDASVYHQAKAFVAAQLSHTAKK